MQVVAAIAAAVAEGVIVGTFVIWVWSVRHDRAKAVRRVLGLVIVSALAVVVLWRISMEVETPAALVAAGLYFAIVAGMWGVAHRGGASRSGESK